jgi:NAD+ kinase
MDKKNLTIAPGDVVNIVKKPHKIRLIHPKTHNFYETCREKLGWAHNLGSS